MLLNLLKKVHIYLGLLTFTILMIFGIIGVIGLALPAPQARTRPEPAITTHAYTPPANATDRQVADEVWRMLRLPLTQPVPDAGLRRGPDNNLVFQHFTPNGNFRITVLEKEGQVRVERRRNRFWQYLNALHAMTIRNPNKDWKIRAWTLYTELSIWALILMSLTGVYLWLETRPRFRWAQASFVAGAVCFCGLWFFSR